MTEPPGHLLIVDDEAPVLEVLSEYFSSQGYGVSTAQNGAEALAAAQQTRPDLVLLDVRMPGMDGVEVLRRLQKLDSTLLVIMVTANEDVTLARETLKIGAFDYVAKPFDFQYLDQAVSAATVHAGQWPAELAGHDSDGKACQHLVESVFRATRTMSPEGRASTGQRLETAALEAAREAAAGRRAATDEWLRQVDLLLALAVELGDLTAASRSLVDKPLGAARKALTGG